MMYQEKIEKQGVVICFSWTARILNHRSFCARLVRNFCVPDTAVKICKNDKVWLLKREKIGLTRSKDSNAIKTLCLYLN